MASEFTINVWSNKHGGYCYEVFDNLFYVAGWCETEAEARRAAYEAKAREEERRKGTS